MFLIGLMVALPFLGGFLVTYILGHILQKRRYRAIPISLGILVTAIVAFARIDGWQSEVSPLTQLLLVPGIPFLFFFLGCFLGNALYHKLWDPKIK